MRTVSFRGGATAFSKLFQAFQSKSKVEKGHPYLDYLESFQGGHDWLPVLFEGILVKTKHVPSHLSFNLLLDKIKRDLQVSYTLSKVTWQWTSRIINMEYWNTFNCINGAFPIALFVCRGVWLAGNSIAFYVPGSINSHDFHIIGDGKLNPIT